MDRKAWIAIILSVLGLVAWQWYYLRTYSRKPPVASQYAASQKVAAAPAPSVAPVATPALAQEAPVVAAKNQSLYSPSAEYSFQQ